MAEGVVTMAWACAGQVLLARTEIVGIDSPTGVYILSDCCCMPVGRRSKDI